jgi:formate hydrogenlyase transcriptional activator
MLGSPRALAAATNDGDEVAQLRSCINHLVGVVSLRAVWRSYNTHQVCDSLLDALVHMLKLEFAYARLNVFVPVPIEMVHVARSRPPADAGLVGRALDRWLAGGRPPADPVTNPAGAGHVRIAPCWLGSERDAGVVVAGAARADFPNDTESLLLRVAVNQALLDIQRQVMTAAQHRAEQAERVSQDLHAENVYLRQEVYGDDTVEAILGHSAAIKRALALAERVAKTNACVLLQGETGTGKERFARAIHRFSDRRERPFVRLNCAAIPAGLVESELFGHERGAFTGAMAQKLGRFEAANHGTLFLDEIGELSVDVQVKLLRVLQEQEFERLGSAKSIRVDVRLIAATNRVLPDMVSRGEFRDDLFYRLNVFPIVVPPLRDRPEDIPHLVWFFMRKYAQKFNSPVAHLEPHTMTALRTYGWPGNVRQLENFVERSVILSNGIALEAPIEELAADSGPRRQRGQPGTLVEIEREHILAALEASNWVISGPAGAAARLGMKRTTLQHALRKLGITRPRT